MRSESKTSRAVSQALPPPPPPLALPLRSTAATSLPNFSHLTIHSTPTTPVSDAPQPVLLRRSTMPVSRPPLLDLNSLPSFHSDEVRTARRRVDSIVSTLSRFTSGLYVGSEQIARDKAALRKYGITHIVNAGWTANYFDDSFRYLRLKIRDDRREKIDAYFSTTNAFIRDALANGGKVAVLCKQGVSRSATIAIAYVMTQFGWSLEDSLSKLRRVRPVAAPNQGFLDALQKLERKVKEERASSGSSSRLSR